MAKVSIQLEANSQGVKREMTTLERFIEGVSKRMSGAFLRGGAGKGVDLLTKQMRDLTKATDAQVAKVNTLAAALQNVNKQMGGAQGPNLTALQQQQKALQRNFTHANTRLGVLQQMGSAATQQAQAAGGPGGGGAAGAAAVGRMGSLGGTLAQGALSLIPGLGALMTVTGIASIVHKAYEESARKEKTMADFLPRLLGPGNIAQGVGFERRLNKGGRPLGFTTNESLQVAETASTGGFANLGGLQRDTKTAEQMARFFGIDAGQQAQLQAEGGRMGAFKPGDAKKFATMLATEISKSGLGPRAVEVQEATLMLLNNQLRTQATSSPGPVMALQTMFNKTGLPAFTGTRGAGMINQINDSITNPRSDAAEALNQQVFLKMGARGVFGMEEMKERGLSDPRYLPTLMRTILKGTHSNAEARFLLKQQTGMTMLQSGALQSKIPGGLAGITERNMGQWQKVLKDNGLDIAGGAAKAMGAKGNKLRMVEATVDEVMQRLGDVFVGKTAELGKKFAEFMKPAFDILDDNTKGTWDQVTRLADHFVGKEADKLAGGGFSDPWGARDSAKRGMQKHVFGEGTRYAILNALLGPDPHGGPLGALGTAHKMGLNIISGFRPGSVIRHGRNAGQPGYHSMGSPSDPGAVDLRGTSAQMASYFDWIMANVPHDKIKEMIFTPKGLVTRGRYFPKGPFDPALRKEHYDHLHMSLKGMGDSGDNHLTIHVQHDGVVGPHAQAQIEHHVDKAIEKATHKKARSQPNKRNMRQ